MSSSCLLVGVVVTGHASSHRAALDAAALCPAAHIDHSAVSVVDFCAHMHSNIACSTAVCFMCTLERFSAEDCGKTCCKSHALPWWQWGPSHAMLIGPRECTSSLTITVVSVTSTQRFGTL